MAMFLFLCVKLCLNDGHIPVYVSSYGRVPVFMCQVMSE